MLLHREAEQSQQLVKTLLRGAAEQAQRIEKPLHQIQPTQDVVLEMAQRFADAQAATAPWRTERMLLPCGDSVLARTKAGWLAAPATDQQLLAALYESGGALELGTSAVSEGLLAPGATVVDAGAHIGLITLPAARRIGDSGRVVAEEPVPDLARLLRRNLRLNGLQGRAIVHQCAAGERSYRSYFYITDVRGHSSLLAPDEPSSSIEVDIRPVDDLIPPGTAFSLAKLDVEGFELPVWRGMRQIVSESPNLAVIVEFGPSHLARAKVTIGDWVAEFKAPGFSPYEIDEVTGLCRPLRTSGLNQLYSINLLLLRTALERFSGLSFASRDRG